MASGPRRYYHDKDQPPAARDAIARRMCLRCGFPGPHDAPVDCITTLRDRIAVLEFRTRAKDRAIVTGNGRR